MSDQELHRSAKEKLFRIVVQNFYIKDALTVTHPTVSKYCQNICIILTQIKIKKVTESKRKSVTALSTI